MLNAFNENRLGMVLKGTLIASFIIFGNQLAKSNEITRQAISPIVTSKYLVEPNRIISQNVRDGEPLVDQMIIATRNLTDYSANYAMSVYKDKQILKESGIFYFRKPKLLRIEVKQGSRKGSQAILAQDGKIHGHMGGLLKYFSGTVSADSDYAKTLNDFPMAGTDFYSLVLYLKNMLKQGDLSLATTDAVITEQVNRPSYILDIYSAIKGSKLLLLKRIFVDSRTFLPLFWQDYSDDKIFCESTWHNVSTDLNLPDKLFQP